MATGDNALTAISVARECGIIEVESEVFLGDTKKEGDKDVLVWKSTKTARHQLREANLEPDFRFYED
jgi:magnesium-transporting ATPase (P-type)